MTIRHVYVACSVSRAEEAQSLAAQLRDNGHVVVSTWHEPDNLRVIREDKNMRDQGSAESATRDYHEICACDLLMVLAVPKGVAFYGGGHTTEVGIALGRGTPVAVIGDRSNVFYHLPWVTVFATPEEAVKWATTG